MYHKFQELCEARDVTPYKVSKATGVSTQALSAWKNGQYTPKQDKIQRIADYFGVPVSYFYEEATLPDRLLVDYPLEWWNRNEHLFDEPVYDVAAGPGYRNETQPQEFIENTKREEEYSYARVHGDSMLPELRDGDIVKVHHQTETNPSDFTLVRINGDEAACKYVEIVENGVWLRAENKEVYPDKFYSIAEVMSLPVQIIGKVVELRREL